MKSTRSIDDTTFIVIDVETTGLNPIQNRITEIGLIKICEGEIIGEYSTLINPKQFIPSSITRLTGITNEMVFDKPEFEEIIPDLFSFLMIDRNEVILAGHNIGFDYKFLISSMKRSKVNSVAFKTLCTSRLARRLNYNLKSRSLSNLINYFGIRTKRRHRALDDAKATAQILLFFLDKLIEDYHIESRDELLSFQFKSITQNSKYNEKLKKIKLELSKIPKEPGVYYMYNSKKKIIYIGKAKNLKERLSSYFYHNISHTNKIIKMLRSVNSVDYLTTDSELSALLLESKEIKENKPKYNSANRRYRRYPFMKIDISVSFPRIIKTYDLKYDGAKYYGPFKSSFTVDAVIDIINKNFKLRKCDDAILKPHQNKTTCMYFEMKQCDAPCNESVDETIYQNEINKVDSFLMSKNKDGLLSFFQERMDVLSGNLNFEDAIITREQLNELRKVIVCMELTSSNITDKNFIVKCPDEDNQKQELFLIKNGMLVKNLTYSLHIEDEDEFQNLMNILYDLYSSENLFNFNSEQHPPELTVENIYELNLISNWILLNNHEKYIFRVTQNTKPRDLMKFIFSEPEHRNLTNCI